MENKFASINILIVTYKQEELIKRALDSILCQKEYGLNKIVICDDCSPDNTWNSIQEYANKYSSYIEAYRNEKNLGIYGNFEKVVSLKGNADLYYLMSGDDALCDGWFQTIQIYLENKREILKIPAIVISDWKQVTLDGTERIYYQNIIENRKVSPSSLKIRGLVCLRSMFQTKELLNLHKPVDLLCGVSKAEKYFDYQPFLYVHQVLYCPYVGSIYYSGIGVSTTATSKEYRREKIDANVSFLDDFPLKKKDISFIQYRIATDEYFISPSLGRYLRKVWNYIKSIDFNIGFSLKDFVRVILNKK